ncbi:hypothetical protein BO78DRAFT_326425 [Aspergillus sclerotiicarbonarius CBS 121057]|uniref:Uncharacterized protein n=1 Tax=Aspergillus sclerotiicarbonarius (strain CBS 121057 / IBT 28362) TaxID=1448318 RepID=A0A319DVX2_ASPSB|nr:hypothetical protein BO78DRAFT_326425 [Aspergillus sclerotiicarbonarius CBS 121057]
MVIPRLFHLLLVIWCAFTSARDPYDLSIRQDPKGPLGVRLDYSLATTWPTALDPKRKTTRNWLWSSHLTFNSPVSAIPDAQLWQMAFDAYNEIQDDMDLYKIVQAKNKPNAMTVLAFGNEIILASSQKGSSSFSYQFAGTEVLRTLQICQILWRETGTGGTESRHRRDGKCGEVMAAHLYYTIHNAALTEQKATVGTVIWNRDENKLEQADPCGDPEKDVWGCNLFTREKGLIELDIKITPEAYDLSTMAGGLSIKDQIQLCTS